MFRKAYATSGASCNGGNGGGNSNTQRRRPVTSNVPTTTRAVTSNVPTVNRRRNAVSSNI